MFRCFLMGTIVFFPIYLACERPTATSGPAPGPRPGASESTASKQPDPPLAKEGGARTLTVSEENREVALLAGGCFWGMEDILREIPGVLDTSVGYTGGDTASPTYDQVKRGTTGHAESVQVVFDRSQLSFSDLLEKWFFKMHDPTTQDRQGNDRGTQYRSAIFYTTEDQRKAAETVKERVQKSGSWRAPLVTEITRAGSFTPAEDYHQDYLEKNPGGYTCHYLRDDVH